MCKLYSAKNRYHTVLFGFMRRKQMAGLLATTLVRCIHAAATYGTELAIWVKTVDTTLALDLHEDILLLSETNARVRARASSAPTRF